jgi:hypothetical protein
MQKASWLEKYGFNICPDYFETVETETNDNEMVELIWGNSIDEEVFQNSRDSSIETAPTNVMINVWNHNPIRTKYIRKHIAKYLKTNVKHKITDCENGKLLTVCLSTDMPLLPAYKEVKSEQIANEIFKCNGEKCAVIVTYNGHRLIMLPEHRSLLNDDRLKEWPQTHLKLEEAMTDCATGNQIMPFGIIMNLLPEGSNEPDVVFVNKMDHVVNFVWNKKPENQTPIIIKAMQKPIDMDVQNNPNIMETAAEVVDNNVN